MVQLISSGINVFILFFLVGYILSPMLTKWLTNRKTQIANSINEARTSKEEAQSLAQMYEEKIANFDDEKEAILDKARAKAKAKQDEIIGEAITEAGRISDRADREAALLRAKVKDDIKNDMVTFATSAAAKLIEEHMDAKVQDELIEQTLNEIGDKTWQS